MTNLKVTSGVSSKTYGDNILPLVGMILPFAGSTAPTGWLLCDGSTFSSTDYPQLYSLLGSTTLPNLREKYLLGYDSSASVRTVGSLVTSSHDHTILYPANDPVNSTAFATNNSSDNHSHTANFAGIGGDPNGGHNHNAAINSYTLGLTNTGNYSQAAPTNAPVSVAYHGHTFGYSFNYYSGNAGHTHSAATSTANNSVSHLHNYQESSSSGTLANSSTSLIIQTVYVNFIIKAG